MCSAVEKRNFSAPVPASAVHGCRESLGGCRGEIAQEARDTESAVCVLEAESESGSDSTNKALHEAL